MGEEQGKPCPECGSDCLARAREALAIEAEAVRALGDRLDHSFCRAAALILNAQGRTVVTGVGKSGSVGRKISATLASTGTPSLFLHPSEGVHGDLGMVVRGDVLIVLSYSGASDEILAILPAMKRIAIPIIAITAGAESDLARYAEVMLDVRVEREACPLNLAPTASTTSMLALGDALAVAVMSARRFGAEDYARLHPSGSLGRRLLLTAGDLMRTGDACAQVRDTVAVRDVLFAITAAHAGAASIVDEEGRLVGIIADGDIRRHLLQDVACLDRPASEIMTRNPRTCSPTHLAAECLEVMQNTARGIGEMPVVDEAGKPLGMLSLKDIVRAGIS